MPCVFCTNVHDSGVVLAEDERTWVVQHPAGQWMVVAKKHVENVSDLDEEEWLHVARVWHRAERELRAITGAARVIVMKLGLQTPHLHVHLYPFDAGASRDEVFAVIDGRDALRLTPPSR
jgi:diadenosine tetraphosphate (Ap4A) HIT family hydrolase